MPNPVNPTTGLILDNPSNAYGVGTSQSPKVFSGNHHLTDDWALVELGSTTDAVIYVSKSSLGNDGNDGVSPLTPLATVAAALLALPSTGGKIILLYGTWVEQVIIPINNVIIEGLGSYLTSLKYNGSGVGLDCNDVGGATLRTGLEFKGFFLDIRGGGSGVIGTRLDNVYKSKWDDVVVSGLGATNSTAMKLIGGTGKSCYFNEFHIVSLVAEGKCLDLGNGCNENYWYGGVFEGNNATAIVCNPTIHDSLNDTGENKFFGVALQTGNATFMQFGASTGHVNNFEFHGCRMEPSASTISLSANTSNFLWVGGTKANVTFTDAGSNNRKMLANSFDPGTFIATGDITATGFLVAQTSLTVGTDTRAASTVASINSAAGNSRTFVWRTAGVNRWQLTVDGVAEAGANAGSDFNISANADDGSGLGTYLSIRRSDGRILLGDGINLRFGSSVGSLIGQFTNDKFAFHGAIPVIQRASAAQAVVATTAATNTTPYGFTTAAQADAIVTLVNELRAAIVQKGLIKGSA